MKLTSVYITIAILLASSSAFKIFRSSTDIQGAEFSQTNSMPTMPCFTVVPEIYKAFSFYSDLADKPYTTEIAEYPGEEGTTA
jgi:hypothetical protein